MVLVFRRPPARLDLILEHATLGLKAAAAFVGRIATTKQKMVVQKNGKKKLLLEVPMDIDQDEVIKILFNHNSKLGIELKTSVKKIIFIKNKIINFVK